MNAPLPQGLRLDGEAGGEVRPITVLLLALGGEGGGTLAEWIVETATAQGLPVQATSVPGVAQRTGATSYYLEMLPVPAAADAPAPVFCLAPAPGDVDLLVSSELLETARALERGMADPARTLLVSSTHRFFTVAEKMAMGDGRFEASRVEAAARALAREAVLFDMDAQTRAAGTVISAVMFGAVAATGVLPLPREACEATIRRGGRASAASLDGFARGFAAVEAARAAARGTTTAGTAADPTAPAAQAATAPTAGADREASQPLSLLLALGRDRLADWQDDAHAAHYLALIEAVREAEARATAGGGADAAACDPARPGALPVSRAAARWLALWMSWEDVIRVADLKTRPERLERLRRETLAPDGTPVTVREFLKPGIEEIAAVLPPSLAARLKAWGARRGLRSLGEGLQLPTTSVWGYALLRVVALLRPLRRRGTRWHEEQALIARWHRALLSALAPGAPGLPLAREIAAMPRLLKGYGETFARGRRSFVSILDTLADPAATQAAADPAARATAIRDACEAALADPEGRALAGALGLPPPAPAERPVRFVARAARRS